MDAVTNQSVNVRLVRVYSYITFTAILYGIAWAHVPILLGTPWDSCDGCSSRLWCILTFHIYEIPIVSYNFYLGWYGLNRFSPEKVSTYCSLLQFSVPINFAFATFEILSIQAALLRHSPFWELAGLLSLSIVLIGGIALTIYIHQKLLFLCK